MSEFGKVVWIRNGKYEWTIQILINQDINSDTYILILIVNPETDGKSSATSSAD